jgi:drug/metabolite transporter (DMT)-like permease
MPLSSSGAAAGVGLLSAASWGGSDFIGGFGARRAPVLLIVVSGHFVTLLILLGVCGAMHLPLPGRAALLFSAVGGFEGAIALALFYRALAMGAMSLTAALTGLLTALVPVLFSILQSGLPTPLIAAGLAVGLAAIWLITRGPDKGAAESSTKRKSTALILGALAGLGFGAQLILFKIATGNGGMLWAMTAARAAGVTAMLLVLIVMPPQGPWRGFWGFGVLAGILDTAGNLLYIQAASFGRLDVAAVVCSLYPGGTILLAALFLKEWPTRRQLAGIALALAAVALLSI